MNRLTKLFLLLAVAAVSIAFTSPSAVIADERSDAATTSPANALDVLLETLQQPADGEVPEERENGNANEDTDKTRKATAYYMTGRSLQYLKKYEEAYKAYQQAIELNPESITLYKTAIPLAFQLEKVEDAIQYAQKAVQLDPDNFELLSQLGIYALRQQNILGSIAYFEKAVESSGVDKKGGAYISIMSQLGQLYQTIGRQEQAASVYEEVFNAIMRPQDYKFDFRTQRALESMKGSKSQTFAFLGEQFLATNRLEKAEAAFKQAAETNRGKSEQFSFQLARVQNKKGEHEKALKTLQTYFDAKLEDQGRGPYLLLAELLVALDREDEIVSKLNALSEADPRNDMLTLYLAEQYVNADRLDEAREIYEQFLGKKQQSEAHLGMLLIHSKEKDAEACIESLTQAMLEGATTARLQAEIDRISQQDDLSQAMIDLGVDSDEEGDARAQFARAYLLGKLSMMRDQFESAHDYYIKAMEIRREPEILQRLYAELAAYLKTADNQERLAELLMEAIDDPGLARQQDSLRGDLIDTYVTLKKPDQAQEVLSQLRESNPDNMQYEYKEGEIYYLTQNWEQAIRVFAPLLEKAMEQGNDSVARTVRYSMSRCLAFMGMAEESLQLITQVLEEEPDDQLWQFQKGWVLYYSHNWDGAVKAYEELLKDVSEDDESSLVLQTKYSLSAAYVQQGRLDAGEEILEKIYNKDPNNISVCNDLGYLYADRGKKLEQAYEMISKALEEEPENNAYLDSMGWVLYRMEKYEEAIEFLEKAVADSESGDAVLWDHLGDCYSKAGETEKAKEAWQKAFDQEQDQTYSDTKLLDKLKEKLK